MASTSPRKARTKTKKKDLVKPLMSSADPFYVVRDTLSRAVDEVAVKYDAWKDVLQNTNTSKNAAFPAQTQGLKKELEQLVRDVGGLAGTVQAVEANRSKFTHISETELDSRRRFVQLTRDNLNNMLETVTSHRTQAKMDADRRAALTASKRTSSPAAATSTRFTRANDDYIAEHQQRQDMMRREADQHLDVIGHSVRHLGEMATTINVELTEQDHMLDDLDRDVDKAQANMNIAMRQMSKLLKTSDKCQIYTILILIAVVAVLFILVLV